VGVATAIATAAAKIPQQQRSKSELAAFFLIRASAARGRLETCDSQAASA
jgi:hypothetical protein